MKKGATSSSVEVCRTVVEVDCSFFDRNLAIRGEGELWLCGDEIVRENFALLRMCSHFQQPRRWGSALQ